jgi:hypothetical protein
MKKQPSRGETSRRLSNFREKEFKNMTIDTAGVVTEPRTAGERLFEEYLRSQGITDFEYEKKREGKRKRPDYTVRLDREYLFDVKDFIYTEVPECDGYNPYQRLRIKIGEMREQFREFKDWPCCAVLYNDNAHLVDLTTPMIVQGAMYGDSGITMKFEVASGHFVKGSEREEFLSGGKMLLRNMKSGTAQVRNTTISALITLRHVQTGYARLCKDFRDRKGQPGFSSGEWVSAERDFDHEEEHVGVIVWENAFARIPFPRNLFCGDYDERYGLDDEGYLRRIYAGKGVLAFEELMGEEISPIFSARGRKG